MFIRRVFDFPAEFLDSVKLRGQRLELEHVTL